MRVSFLSAAAAFCLLPVTLFAQLSPGPIEVLPPEEAYIFEAWYDLEAGSGRADWTGWRGTTWVSPHAYNGHTGSDFSLNTGTPLHACVAGEVVELANDVPEGSHPASYGNYVKIAAEGTSPEGLPMTVLTAHMLPNVQVTVGQHVEVGDLVGYSDNTGNSTSEHLHLETAINGSYACPFYIALFKYPIMFNANAFVQVGHVVRVKAESTVIRADRTVTSASLGTVYRQQMFFSSYAQQGYYRVFIPNDTSNRSGWIKATDCEELFRDAQVIQALPDAGAYVHTQTLASPYPILQDPEEGAQELGRIYYGGGRFVADEAQSGWFRIPVPNSAQWGWVKADNRMIVYPELYNPAVNVEARQELELPAVERFEETGTSYFGRPKFTRCDVGSAPAGAPNGDDGKALFLTDTGNTGDGAMESVIVGRVDDRDTFVQCDVYFDFAPAISGYNRYGVFLRDDGFAGMDRTFEGDGACYAILYDSDDGRLRALKIDNPNDSDNQPNYLPTERLITQDGWHTMRIEAEGDEIRFFLDGELLVAVTDTTYPSGYCGIGYSDHASGTASLRGAWFDNFEAGYLLEPQAQGWALY